jgi:hypothetical protein
LRTQTNGLISLFAERRFLMMASGCFAFRNVRSDNLLFAARRGAMRSSGQRGSAVQRSGLQRARRSGRPTGSNRIISVGWPRSGHFKSLDGWRRLSDHSREWRPLGSSIELAHAAGGSSHALVCGILDEPALRRPEESRSRRTLKRSDLARQIPCCDQLGFEMVRAGNFVGNP